MLQLTLPSNSALSAFLPHVHVDHPAVQSFLLSLCRRSHKIASTIALCLPWSLDYAANRLQSLLIFHFSHEYRAQDERFCLCHRAFVVERQESLIAVQGVVPIRKAIDIIFDVP